MSKTRVSEPSGYNVFWTWSLLCQGIWFLGEGDRKFGKCTWCL